jgi:DNA-binding NarL/FixJ family response regulator
VATTKDPSEGDAVPQVSRGVVAGTELRLQPRAHGGPRVLVVDHRAIMRAGVSGLLREAGIDVVAEASGPGTVLNAADDIQPDVVLVTLGRTAMRGADAVRRITAEAPGASVIVMASPDDPDLLAALAAGASGALVEGASGHEIVAAVRAAARGEPVYSRVIARALMRRLRLVGNVRRPDLTSRELEVLQLLARGWDNGQIAAALHLSVGTVKHHISSLLAKLDVDNRLQAAVRAVEEDLIEG